MIYCYEVLSCALLHRNRFIREGVLELTHNHGTESDDSFKGSWCYAQITLKLTDGLPGYHNGNSEPKGFGHIAFSVPNMFVAF